MIAQNHRFHGHNKVVAVYRRSQTLRGNLLIMKYTTGGSRPYRAAVVVSKKVSKSAVVRNRIRRRIYEVVRQFSPAALDGHELVFIVYSNHIASLESPRLKAAIHDLLQRATSGTNRGSGRAIIETLPLSGEEEH